jgi:threonine/homoserine/homoserine lactone efflux protein
MDFSNICLFISISLILLISPGPNTIYVITQGMTHGRKTAFKAVIGATTGDIVQVLAAFWGLAALLEASSLAFFVIKIVGAVYLFYIGVKCFFANGEMLKCSDEAKVKGSDLFFSGFLTSVLNPKTTLFFFSFLPQFIDSKSYLAHQQMLLFGIMFVLLGFIVMTAYVIVAGKMKMWIAKNERVQTYFQWLTGTIFIGFGLRLAFTERK